MNILKLEQKVFIDHMPIREWIKLNPEMVPGGISPENEPIKTCVIQFKNDDHPHGIDITMSCGTTSQMSCDVGAIVIESNEIDRLHTVDIISLIFNSDLDDLIYNDSFNGRVDDDNIPRTRLSIDITGSMINITHNNNTINRHINILPIPMDLYRDLLYPFIDVIDRGDNEVGDGGIPNGLVVAYLNAFNGPMPLISFRSNIPYQYKLFKLMQSRIYENSRDPIGIINGSILLLTNTSISNPVLNISAYLVQDVNFQKREITVRNISTDAAISTIGIDTVIEEYYNVFNVPCIIIDEMTAFSVNNGILMILGSVGPISDIINVLMENACFDNVDIGMERRLICENISKYFQEVFNITKKTQMIIISNSTSDNCTAGIVKLVINPKSEEFD